MKNLILSVALTAFFLFISACDENGPTELRVAIDTAIDDSAIIEMLPKDYKGKFSISGINMTIRKYSYYYWNPSNESTSLDTVTFTYNYTSPELSNDKTIYKNTSDTIFLYKQKTAPWSTFKDPNYCVAALSPLSSTSGLLNFKGYVFNMMQFSDYPNRHQYKEYFIEINDVPYEIINDTLKAYISGNQIINHLKGLGYHYNAESYSYPYPSSKSDDRTLDIISATDDAYFELLLYP